MKSTASSFSLSLPRPKTPDLIAGVVVGMFEVIFVTSLSSLIFTGSLEMYLPLGIGLAMVSSIVSLLTAALFSSFKGVMSHVQDAPVVLMAVAMPSLIAATSPGNERIATVLVFIACTGIFSGLVLAIIGRFSLGGLVRFIPYPVIGGFLAGTGWLLVSGALSTMVGFTITTDSMPDVFSSKSLAIWVPGLICGAAIFIGARRISHHLAVPGLIFASAIVFYVAMPVLSISVDQATDDRLLLGEVGRSTTWEPLSPDVLSDANWGAIWDEAETIVTIALLTVVSLLLSISGLELALREDADLNRELRFTGVANVLNGLAGGLIFYHSLSGTLFSRRMNVTGMTCNFVAAGLLALVLIAGSSLMAYIPRPVLGGVVLFVGFELLYEWVVQGYQRFSTPDFAIVMLVLLTVAVSGFIVAVAVGLVATIMLFVINYSRIDIFHSVSDSGHIRSNVERSAHFQQALKQNSEHIYVMRLKGYIFFGTANQILDQVRARVDDPDKLEVQFVVMDFQRVSGLDVSTVLSFSRLLQLAEARGFTVIITHLRSDFRLLLHGLTTGEVADRLTFMPDLDRGLEWCEEHVLDMVGATRKHVPVTIPHQLEGYGLSRDLGARLEKFLEPIRVEEGESLIKQDELASDLYFIVVGQVSIYFQATNGRRIRLRTMGAGTVVGEIGFFMNRQRTADVVADTTSLVRRLSKSSLERMRREDPELALAFKEMILRIISERLIAANHALAAYQ